MSTEQGTITKLYENKAWVKVRRSSMCSACNCKSACSTLGGEDIMEAEAINSANAQVGDRVLLKIPGKALWKISFVLYMIPVIFLIAGVIVGMNLAKSYALEPELGGLILGILGCTLSYLIIKFVSRAIRNDKGYVPEIVKVI